MKIKLIITSLSLLCAGNQLVNAQLKVTNSGLVGIGTTAPSNALDVVGNGAVFKATSSTVISAPFIKCANLYSGAANPDYTWITDQNTGIFHGAAGRVSISTLGYETLRIGDGGVSNAINFYCFGTTWCTAGWTSSDARFKKNIATLDKALDKIIKLRGVSYEYKTEEFKKLNFGTGNNLGFIAQEMQAVVPELVKADADGYLAVNYSAVVPLLVEAIKEQQKQIEGLKTELSNLRKGGK